jgi:hypothetical protein
VRQIKVLRAVAKFACARNSGFVPNPNQVLDVIRD